MLFHLPGASKFLCLRQMCTVLEGSQEASPGPPAAGDSFPAPGSRWIHDPNQLLSNQISSGQRAGCCRELSSPSSSRRLSQAVKLCAFPSWILPFSPVSLWLENLCDKNETSPFSAACFGGCVPSRASPKPVILEYSYLHTYTDKTMYAHTVIS